MEWVILITVAVMPDYSHVYKHRFATEEDCKLVVKAMQIEDDHQPKIQPFDKVYTCIRFTKGMAS